MQPAVEVAATTLPGVLRLPTACRATARPCPQTPHPPCLSSPMPGHPLRPGRTYTSLEFFVTSKSSGWGAISISSPDENHSACSGKILWSLPSYQLQYTVPIGRPTWSTRDVLNCRNTFHEKINNQHEMRSEAVGYFGEGHMRY